MSKKKLFIVFILLNIIDAILTVNILQLGGTELNPIMNGVIALFGYWGIFLFKIVFLFVMWFFVSKMSKIMLVLLNAAFVSVVVINMMSYIIISGF